MIDESLKRQHRKKNLEIKFLSFTSFLCNICQFLLLTAAAETGSVGRERDELWVLCGSSGSSPFLRSLSGGRLCVGCSESSSISWVTASLWGLGTSRFDIPQSPSAPKRPWEAWGSILPQEGGGWGRL